MLATSDDWIEQVKSKEFWAKIGRQGGNSSSRSRIQEQPSRVGGPAPALANVAIGKSGEFGQQRRSVVDEDDGDDESGGRKGGSGGNTYRTVCVRLCDGFYTPLSFSTTRDNLERDSERCESSCGGQARMFYYKNPGSEVEDMEDLDGKAYKKLPTAFLYRTTYNAQCICRPQPWSQEAMDRHKLYALQEAGTKGDKAAKKQADEMVARQKKAESDAAAERAAAEKAAKKAKAAEKEKKPTNDKSADLRLPGVQLVTRGMTVPLAGASRLPMTEANVDGRTTIPAVTRPSLLKKLPGRPSPFEAEHVNRTRTADVNPSRL